jgi:hypothetical protein
MYSSNKTTRAYQRIWYSERRRSFLSGKKCEVCSLPATGISYKKGSEKKSPFSMSKGRLLVESKLFMVLCGVHMKERVSEVVKKAHTRKIKHGTNHAYLSRKCRCVMCKSEYSKNRKLKYIRNRT